MIWLGFGEGIGYCFGEFLAQVFLDFRGRGE
jgi:hypothetical protein